MTTLFTIRRFPTLLSTNTFAKELIATTAPGDCLAYTVVTCDKQTKGYGTHGRSWSSLQGNLFFSLIWPLDGLSTAHTGDLALVAGFALLSWARPWFPRERLTLKWPNDVHVNGLKMAGILIEIEPPYAVVGVGLNLVASPPEVAEATYFNRYSQKAISAEQALLPILESLGAQFQVYQAQGLAALIPQMLPFFVKTS